MDMQKYCENQYIMLVHDTMNSNNSYQFLTVTVSNDLLATKGYTNKNHKHVATSPI